MTDCGMHFLYGNTNDSSCVPDAGCFGCEKRRSSSQSARAASSERACSCTTATVSQPFFDGARAASFDGICGSASELSLKAAQPGPVLDADGAMVLSASFHGGDLSSLDALIGQYLVDAFVVWECWDDCEAASSPLLDGAMVLSASFHGGDLSSLDALIGQYLVDAFVVWECWDDCEAASSPLLLRFEDFDAVFSAETEESFSLWCGSLDVAAPMKGVFEDDERDGENERTCYAWVRTGGFSEAVGCRLDRAERAAPNAIELDFESLEIRLEADGPSVRRRPIATPTAAEDARGGVIEL